MLILRWVFMAILALSTGILFVKSLTVHPLKMAAHIVVLCFSIFFLVLLLATSFNGGNSLSAMAIALILIALGYLGMARVFLSREDPRQIPELIRSEDDPGLGHTAVVYFTHGEPETYDPIGWINQFNEFDSQGIPFVPLFARPLFVNKLRNSYLALGRSNHRGMHLQMLKRLEQVYRQQGDDKIQFYYSFLDDDPRPDAAVIQALNDGASRIIVCEVFLTISNHTAEGKELIEALDVEQRFGIPIVYTGPMYDSETLKTMFVQRAADATGGASKSEVGILLVGHGQPDEWDKEWGTETALEMDFRNAVLRKLAQAGYPEENLSLAWMEFKEPKPAEKIEEFVASGVKKVLYFAAAISADALHSQWDVPELVREAKVPDSVQLINLGAWNDDPIVIQAIKEKIDAVLDAA